MYEDRNEEQAMRTILCIMLAGAAMLAVFLLGACTPSSALHIQAATLQTLCVDRAVLAAETARAMPPGEAREAYARRARDELIANGCQNAVREYDKARAAAIEAAK